MHDAWSHLSSVNPVFGRSGCGAGGRTHRQSLCGFTEAEFGHSGVCVRCAPAADGRYGCLCLQASLPTVKSSPARKRPSGAEPKRTRRT
ncbi:unnamed protein product [Tetraodon nigroviridis]|uniref:(spotted green pufferfish) hypothetical protein n=1 Tax=Tetraodon nigroviridis TaxID=99883 RepID=Q4RSW4_TETNG|nr:unnamed protein product [Tetraodon nigroviridis]